jgi:hypothetical protein
MIDLEQIRGNIDRGQLSQADALALVSEVERLIALRAVETDDVKKAHAMGFEDGVLQERADVVAWLQRGQIGWMEPCCTFTLRESWNAIERGEHRREGES